MFKTIAELPEDTFESFISEKKSAVDNAINELTTSGIVAFAKGKPHILNNSGEIEWYTPEHIIESARTVMGSIDLDPASTEIANRIVKAGHYYTKEDNGIEQKWFGNVWLNPPYSQPLMSNFSDAIIRKVEEFDRAIVLVNNATETQWLFQLLETCDAVCFTFGRIKYLDINLKPVNSPLQGQCILYFGEDIFAFKHEFRKHGICMREII